MTRGTSKYAPEDYAEMRRLYHSEGWSQARIARKYDMSEVQVGRIVRGVSQRNAPNPNPPLPEAQLAQDIAESEARMKEFVDKLADEKPPELPEELKPKKPNPYV